MVGVELDLLHVILKNFGCIFYAHVPIEEITKLNEKSQKCIFLGYSDVTKGY